MALFYISQAAIHCTDGTAASGTPTAPAGAVLRDLTSRHRSGGDFSGTMDTFAHGKAGRPVGERGAAFHQMHSISQLVLEQDDAPNSTIDVFHPVNMRPENPRVYRKTYRTGVSNAILCIYKGYSNAEGEGGELLMNVDLEATDALVRVG